MSSKRRRSRDDSERAQRERLAKARRDRERKARANLAAKARGDEPEEDSKERDAAEKPKDPKRAGKPKDEPKGREREGKAKDGERAGKPKDRERAEPEARGDKRSSRGAGKPGGRERSGAAGRIGTRRKGARRKPAGDRKRGAGVLAAAGGIVKDARSWLVATVPRIGGLVLRAVLTFFRFFFAAIGLVLGLAAAAWAFAGGPVREALERTDRLLRAASRALTPARALTAVAAGALVLLALSQFADYRSISIGNDSYAPGIQTVAPAPVTETDATGSAHGYAMVPLAAIGLLLLAAAVTGRRRLCGALALIGVAAVFVALVHDRPAGLDTGDRPLAYEGVKATLVGGFYAQIAAGLVLLASSLLLSRELRLAASGEPAKGAQGRSAWRRPRLRRRTRVQGARA